MDEGSSNVSSGSENITRRYRTLFVSARTDLATKADPSDLKGRVIKWNVGMLIALAAIILAIVKLT